MTLSEYGIIGGINCIEEIKKHTNRKYSFTSLGRMDSGYHLLEEMAKGHVKFLGSKGQIIHIEKKHRVLIFGDISDNDKKLLQYLAIKNTLVSPFELDFLANSTITLEKDFVYKLENVFNHDNYASKKKIKNRLIYPFKWLKSNNIVIQPNCNSVEEIEVFHNNWVEKKMSLKSTIKFYFPKKHYFNVFKRTLDDTGINYVTRFFYKEDELVGVRILSQEGDYVFDLANVINFWDYSQLSNYVYVYMLDYFYKNGIKYFNAGGTGGHKGLSSYKTHYPYFIEPFYSYKRDKNPIRMKTLGEWV